MRFNRLFALVFSLGTLGSSTSVAQVAPNNEALHRQGMALRTQHRNEEARALFEQLWTRTSEPRARARQALAEQALGLFAEVEAHLVEALSHETDPWISQNRFVLQPILEQARAGQRVSILRIRCASPDAQVLMNGSAPVPVGGDLRVLAGSVTFVVRAPGFSDLERTVQLRAGATVIEEITLERIAETHANTTGIGQTSTAITGATGAAVDVAIVPPRLPVDRRATTLRTVGWVSAGGSAGFAVTGIIAQIVMMNAAYRWNSEEICGPDTQRPSTECLRDAQQARDMDVVRTIGFVGGGALAVAAVTLLAIPSVAPRDRARVRCVPSFGSTVVTCGGVF